MTNFEAIIEDIETFAQFLSLINDGGCECCIVQEECEKLMKAGETHKLCVRSWCAWLNKE